MIEKRKRPKALQSIVTRIGDHERTAGPVHVTNTALAIPIDVVFTSRTINQCFVLVRITKGISIVDWILLLFRTHKEKEAAEGSGYNDNTNDGANGNSQCV